MKRISDMGRLIAVPAFAVMMVPNVYALYKDMQTLLPVNTTKAIDLTNHLILLGFYGLLILFYFLRSPAKSTSKSFVTNAIAVTTCFMPLVLFDLTGKAASSPTLIVASDLIILLGMGLVIYSLSVLGRSFSIIPQARKLVQKGPYKLVRHPLYLGELVSVFGIILMNVTFLNLFSFLALAACQIYRSLREEQLLEEIFPEYKEYRSRTYRLVPGIL